MVLSPEEIRAVPFASAPLPVLLKPLGALKSEAERSGLLVIEDLARVIDHPVLGNLLSLAVDGMSPGDLAAFGLGAAVGKDSGEATRILLFTFFAVLLQTASRDTESELRSFLERKSPCRSIADALIRGTMPLHYERLLGGKPGLREIVEGAGASDAHSLYIGGLLSLGLPDLGEAVDLLDRFRSAYGRIHPFQWAFQDYLSTLEVEKGGTEGLLGVLRFGFLAGPAMSESFHLLSRVRDTGRAGPFTNFLLGMLHLYREESVPYDAEKAFALVLDSADQGSALGAEWKAGFLGSRQTPAFPGNAVPRSIRGTEVFSAGEIDLLLAAFGDPGAGENPAVPAWYDPERAAEDLLGPSPGWSGLCLRARAVRAAAAGTTDEAWGFVRRCAVLGESWAVATVVGAWSGSTLGLFAPKEDGLSGGLVIPSGLSASSLVKAIRGDRRSRPIVVLAARHPLHRTDAAALAERLEGGGAPRDPELQTLLRTELDKAEAADRNAPGAMTQAEIDELLGNTPRVESQ
ncbi:MAG TPA: hypothetical protein P5313_01850 [Spirochaetia bacterium]|nr:hypothetical protein [Spirochaetia bacterium]